MYYVAKGFLKNHHTAEDAVHEAIIQIQKQQRIVDAILQMPDTYKDTLFLSCVQEMSSKEIGVLLDINAETVKKRSPIESTFRCLGIGFIEPLLLPPQC